MFEYLPSQTCPLTVDVHSSSTATLLVVVGEIDLGTVPLLEEAITEAMDRNAPRVELDLSGVSFADSSALSAIMRVRRDAGSRLVVGRCSDTVERLFEITGVNPLLGRVQH